jgi:thiol:disulfide interchange protein DsbD
MARSRTIGRRAVATAAALVAISLVLLVAPVPAAQIMRQDRASLTAGAIAAEPLVRGQIVRAAVALEVAMDLHVNANPPTYDYLIPVTISIEGQEGITLARSFYPEAEHVEFPYADEPLAVYEGTVVIGMELEIAADAPLGDHTIELSVRYQACNDRSCFAPANASLTLPVTVASEGTVAEEVDSPLLSRAPFPGS